VNVYYNSSWCLFKMNPEADDEEGASSAMDYQDEEDEDRKLNVGDGDLDMEGAEKPHDREERRRYRPYKFSGKTYSFDVNNERGILDEMRHWAINYFAKELVITKEMYKLLKDLKGGSGENGGGAGS
jgi:hypothetical protein